MRSSTLLRRPLHLHPSPPLALLTFEIRCLYQFPRFRARLSTSPMHCSQSMGISIHRIDWPERYGTYGEANVCVLGRLPLGTNKPRVGGFPFLKPVVSSNTCMEWRA